MANVLSLTKISAGERGIISAIEGGYGLVSKLDAMGIRIGKEVTKVSAQWMRGPVLLRQGNTQVAIGFGMAQKILVEVCNNGGEA